MQARRTGRKHIARRSAKQSRADEHLSFRDIADPGTPSARGLYDPALDKDSCGVGFIADLKGRKSHKSSTTASPFCSISSIAARLGRSAHGRRRRHPGADPHKFFAKEAARLGFKLPKPGEYAAGYLFMPTDVNWRQIIRDVYAEVIAREGLSLLGLREVPTDNSTLVNRSSQPSRCIFRCSSAAARRLRGRIRAPAIHPAQVDLECDLQATRAAYLRLFPVSISCRTVIYKGMFLADQLGAYYPDLHDPDFESALALVHQRFSTNTFPTWSLAHPYRYIAHNGEINTLRGNVNWMAARQASVSSPLSGPTSTSCGRSPTRASPTPPASTTRSSSWCRAATRSPMP